MTTITLKLDDMAHGGDAVGLYEGKVVFVPLGIPGETVRVQLVEERRRFSHGRLVQVLKPAPERVAPPCRYFGLCGGCQWQHIDYEAQLRFKQHIVCSQIERIARQSNPVVRPVIGMHIPWAYRNHVQFRVDRRGQLGYYASKSHDVVPVDECWITHPLLNELREALDVQFEGLQRISLRAGIATGEQMVIFEGDSRMPPALVVDRPVSCLYRSGPEGITIMAGNSTYHEKLGNHAFRISAPSFFQVNTLQAERIIDVVRGYLDLQPDETLLDAYCGVGTFAISLKPYCSRALGIEVSPWAIEDALANDSQRDCEFVLGDIARVLSDLQMSCDAIILDPPRPGCTPAALEAMAHCNPQRIVYVSCEPATLARDISRLVSLGYSLVEVQPIDMFPQTHHIESVALLHRE